MHASTGESMCRSTGESIGESIGESMGELIGGSIGESIGDACLHAKAILAIGGTVSNSPTDTKGPPKAPDKVPRESKRGTEWPFTCQ